MVVVVVGLRGRVKIVEVECGRLACSRVDLIVCDDERVNRRAFRGIYAGCPSC